MPAITVENVSKKYRKGQLGYRTLREDLYNLTGQLLHLRKGSRRGYEERYMWALRDVSFQVEKGERLGIIGANGSGKTTMLRLLAGITNPTEGKISLKGRMGVLIELMAGFHPELTGRENIYLNGAIMGLSRKEIKRKFDEIVSFSGIEDWIDTPIKRYSSGMHVRLGFAVSAHLEPEILLIDEVLAVGDAEFQKKCMGKMEDAAGEGRTVVFVSHNMASIRELCPRVILLQDGCVVKDGQADEVVSEYLSTEADLFNGDMDVTDPSLRRNSLPDSRFRWTRVTVLNSEGKATSMLALGEPFDVVLQGVANSDLSDALAGFSIDSVLGPAVFNSYQIDNGLPAQLPAGEVRFRIRMDPNLLAPGLYKISLGATGAGVIDFLPTTLQLSIATVGTGDENIWRRHNLGMIRYPCKWYME